MAHRAAGVGGVAARGALHRAHTVGRWSADAQATKRPQGRCAVRDGQGTKRPQGRSAVALCWARGAVLCELAACAFAGEGLEEVGRARRLAGEEVTHAPAKSRGEAERKARKASEERVERARKHNRHAPSEALGGLLHVGAERLAVARRLQ